MERRTQLEDPNIIEIGWPSELEVWSFFGTWTLELGAC
jgi:hypothetical protein